MERMEKINDFFVCQMSNINQCRDRVFKNRIIIELHNDENLPRTENVEKEHQMHFNLINEQTTATTFLPVLHDVLYKIGLLNRR